MYEIGLKICTCCLYLNESFCIPSRTHGRDCRQPSARGPTYFIQKYKIQKYKIQNTKWKNLIQRLTIKGLQSGAPFFLATWLPICRKVKIEINLEVRLHFILTPKSLGCVFGNSYSEQWIGGFSVCWTRFPFCISLYSTSNRDPMFIIMSCNTTPNKEYVKYEYTSILLNTKSLGGPKSNKSKWI